MLPRLHATLAGEERLLAKKARVRLFPPVEDRLPIEIFAYVVAPDLDILPEVQEDLMLKLLEVIAGEGLCLAPPGLALGGSKKA